MSSTGLRLQEASSRAANFVRTGVRPGSRDYYRALEGLAERYEVALWKLDEITREQVRK